jgi:hypothetical protein
LIANRESQVSVALATSAGTLARGGYARALSRLREDLFVADCASISCTDEDVNIVDEAIKIAKRRNQFYLVPFDFCGIWWPRDMDNQFQTGQPIGHHPSSHATEFPKPLKSYLQSVGIGNLEHFVRWFDPGNLDSRAVLWQVFASVAGYNAKAQNSEANLNPGNDLLLGSLLLPFFAAIDPSDVSTNEAVLPGFLTRPICTRDQSSRNLIHCLHKVFLPLKLDELHPGKSNDFKLAFDLTSQTIRISVKIDCKHTGKHGVSLFDAFANLIDRNCVELVKGGEVTKACASLLTALDSWLAVSLESEQFDGEPWTCFVFGVEA